MGRQWYLDLLRVISIAAVVVIHTAAQYWSSLSVTSYEWNIANVFDGAVRWAVPVFVMISGALFLNPKKEQPIKKLYSKNVLRIVTIILFWGLVYALLRKPPADLTFSSLYEFFEVWVLGHYHMWFLYMIAGLYIMVPVLRCITASEQATAYFLLVAFAVNSVVPFLTSFGRASLLSELVAKMMFEVPVGYSFYFVLGYWLSARQFTLIQRRVMLLGGVIGIVATIAFTRLLSIDAGGGVQTFYNYLSLPVCLASVGVFAGGKTCCHGICDPEKKHPLLMQLSASTLGVYMIHIIVLDQLMKWGVDSMSFNPALAIPLSSALAIVISFALAVMMTKIPFFNRHFV